MQDINNQSGFLRATIIKQLFIFCLLTSPLLTKAQVGSVNTDSITKHHFTIGQISFPPKPNSLVTDYTQATLSADEVQKLENKLDSFSNEKTAQIAVVIMRSIGTRDIMFYGTSLAKRWGVGYKNVNNGVLVLVSLQERQAAILVGTGLEKALPDELCHQIIQTTLIPNFRKQQYYTGLDECTNELMKYVLAKK